MTDIPDQPIETMRKKPAQARAWHTILSIFQATAQLLERRSDDRLTTNKVAERAGVSIGTLYQYFPSMEAIFSTMIDLERRRVITALDRLVEQGEAEGADPTPVIRAYIRQYIADFGVSKPGMGPLLRKGWMMDHLPAVQALTQECTERIRLSLVRRRHPDFPAPDDATLFVISRGIQGAVRCAVLENSPLLGTPAFENALVDMILSMLRKDRLPPPINDAAQKTAMG